MRIVILTLPLNTNYGGIMQAYALQTVLERMGHEVTVLHHVVPPLKVPLWRWSLRYAKRLVKKILIDHHVLVFREQRAKQELPVLTQHLRKFIDTQLHLRILERLTDIKAGEYDAIVVGSDQVWRPRYFKPMWESPMREAFLDFARTWDVKRIAYAASFGVDNWEYNDVETTDCARLLKLFDIVSVREQSGVRLCEDHLSMKATHVLDPTMLLTKEDYERLITREDENDSSEGNFLFAYILDGTREKNALIERMAKERKLTVRRMQVNLACDSRPIEQRISPSVGTWLRSFRDASMVVTDSFHACVFSVLFRKPFIALGNEGRGMSRFLSLLSMFNLQDRLLLSPRSPLPKTPIDYGKVDTRLEELREVAFGFLRKGLDL